MKQISNVKEFFYIEIVKVPLSDFFPKKCTDIS